MVTAKAPGPAELVFTTNSHGDPEEVMVWGQFSSAAHIDNNRNHTVHDILKFFIPVLPPSRPAP